VPPRSRRGNERGIERAIEREFERGIERRNERGIERGNERIDRPNERGIERRNERGNERGIKRSLGRDLDPRLSRSSMLSAFVGVASRPGAVDPVSNARDDLDHDGRALVTSPQRSTRSAPVLRERSPTPAPRIG
jgi:hypothetical protein